MTYACTFIEKTVSVDDYETGCELQSFCIMADPVNIVADSIPKLIGAIGDYLGIDIQDCWVPDFPANRIGFNQCETVEGYAPTEGQIARWKRGDCTLYLADYHFTIERREVSPIPETDFAGVKFHQ
jgi:hypothetical protein